MPAVAVQVNCPVPDGHIEFPLKLPCGAGFTVMVADALAEQPDAASVAVTV